MRVLSALLVASALLVSGYASAGLDANAVQSTRIASLQPGRDYTIEGNVQTLWETTFLLNDGSAQVIVDLGTRSPYALGLRSQSRVQISGHLDNGRFIPLVLVNTRGGSTAFTGTDTYPQLDAADVKSNTERWTLTTKQIEGMSGNNKGGGRGSSADISETTGRGAATPPTTISTSPTPTSPPPER